MKKGKSIAIMGINNVGKTTQQDMLVQTLNESGYLVKSLKYPLYDLAPTGSRINDYLRNGNPEDLTPKEFQELCAQNRFDFQAELEVLLEKYHFIILEMYTGSGICFGMADGVSKDELVAMNEGLLIPDVSILLDGQRFLEARESGHSYEQNDEKMDIIRQYHLELARDWGWHLVNANQSIEEVHTEIFSLILGTNILSEYCICVDENDHFLGFKKRNDCSQKDIIRISGLWIENEKGEILISQRSQYKVNNPGKWGPAVAGTLEAGESYLSSILKETNEEIGVSLRAEDVNFIGSFLGGDTHRYFAGTFFAELSSETNFTLQKEEVEAVRWISWGDLEKEIENNPEMFLISPKSGIMKRIKEWKQKI